jgi:regulator of nucleoside diphosphate kinase
MNPIQTLNNMSRGMNTKANVVISSLDAERLERLIDTLPMSAYAVGEKLEEEIARADIVEPQLIPPTVVTMNSTVRFKVDSSSEEFTMTLVYPKNVDVAQNKISILAPVGSAMLGLEQGAELEWPKPGLGMLKVRIEEVTYQPERAGDYHR